MALYAIGDLHLSLGTDKPMDVFGPDWAGYVSRLEKGFSGLSEDDVTVLCGDISWGMSLAESREDFLWIDRLPGKKLIVKGNHDYWWSTAARMRRFFSEIGAGSLEILHNNCFFYGDYALCGTRGWFYEEDAGAHTEKMVAREVGRLEASFRAAGGRPILAFLHYPPLYAGYRCEPILQALGRYPVERCFYGHLHGAARRRALEGTSGGVEFSLVSADELGFVPKKILDK